MAWFESKSQDLHPSFVISYKSALYVSFWVCDMICLCFFPMVLSKTISRKYLQNSCYVRSTYVVVAIIIIVYFCYYWNISPLLENAVHFNVNTKEVPQKGHKGCSGLDTFENVVFDYYVTPHYIKGDATNVRSLRFNHFCIFLLCPLILAFAWIQTESSAGLFLCWCHCSI